MYFATTLMVAFSLAYSVLSVPIECPANLPWGHHCTPIHCLDHWPDHDPVYHSPPGWVPEASFPTRDGAFVLPMPVTPFAETGISGKKKPKTDKREDGLMYDPNETGDIGNCCRWNYECYKFIVQNAVNLVSDKTDWQTYQISRAVTADIKEAVTIRPHGTGLTIAPPEICANPEPRTAV